jgi:hypothetical protein
MACVRRVGGGGQEAVCCEAGGIGPGQHGARSPGSWSSLRLELSWQQEDTMMEEQHKARQTAWVGRVWGSRMHCSMMANPNNAAVIRAQGNSLATRPKSGELFPFLAH